MPATPDRINRQRHVTAMVALDTFDLLAARVVKLLESGRRMTLVTRYTYTGHTPVVTPGLTLYEPPKVWHQEGGAAGINVQLQPGIRGFGFAIFPGDGNDTEAEAWRRYRAGKAESEKYSERRRDMIEVEIQGGMPGDLGPARDDQLIIRHWNQDGVCQETVVAFDYDTQTQPAEGVG